MSEREECGDCGRTYDEGHAPTCVHWWADHPTRSPDSPDLHAESHKGLMRDCPDPACVAYMIREFKPTTGWDSLRSSDSVRTPDLDAFTEAAADAHAGWYLYETERFGKSKHAPDWGLCERPICRERLVLAALHPASPPQEGEK
jgi:hypothetical protein